MVIDAIVLAAGQGTRMSPLTRYKPKPLVLFRGRPLICWTLDAVHPHMQRIIVVTNPFHEQFDDLPYSYPKVKLYRSRSRTMLGAFWDGFRLTDSEYIFCCSSDVAYDPSVVRRFIKKMGDSNAAAFVGLKTSYEGGEKQWDWVIEDGRVLLIRRSTSRTSYERFFFACRRQSLIEFKEKMGCSDGADPNDLLGKEELGSGWIYLLSHMVKLGMRVQAEVFNDEYLQNVNRTGDLEPAAAHCGG